MGVFLYDSSSCMIETVHWWEFFCMTAVLAWSKQCIDGRFSVWQQFPHDQNSALVGVFLDDSSSCVIETVIFTWHEMHSQVDLAQIVSGAWYQRALPFKLYPHQSNSFQNNKLNNLEIILTEGLDYGNQIKMILFSPPPPSKNKQTKHTHKHNCW